MAKKQLSKPQEALLKKLIQFEECMWDYDAETLTYKLYGLFFDWSKVVKPQHDRKKEKEDAADGSVNDADQAEKKKIAMFNMSQEM